MAAAIGWPISKHRRTFPERFERQLLLSYMTVFVAILAAFAIAAHTAFAVVFEHESQERLHTMLHDAESVVDSTPSGFSIDLTDQTIRALDPSAEGLRWSDASGHAVARYGLSAAAQNVRTLKLSTDAGPPTRHPVVIEAIESWAPYASRMRAIDAGIIAALLLAILGSVVAGQWLTHRLVRRLERNLKALEDFTADAAHELRGPLTVVATNAASAVPAGDDRLSIARDAMESISSATAQMIHLSEDLLTLARANQPLERELFAVDVDTCVSNVVAFYRDIANAKDIAFEADCARRMRIYGNPDQIERIVANLVRNAIQYTPRGGRIAVVCSDDLVRCRVTISDNGPGIAAGNLERIFDRFWRADAWRTGEGTGLGLTIARDLARRHGGDVTVESWVGRGSSFTATFPLRPPSGVSA